MGKKVLVIGGIAAAAVLAGGWALAQSGLHGRGGFGPPFMRGEGVDGMGQGMMQHMGRGMGPGMMQNMGPGMMGAGMGMRGTMQHDSTMMAELRIIHELFVNHDSIKRTVTNLPNGIRTVTESDDPQIAGILKDHVASMIQRVGEGRDPMLPIESPALHGIFVNKDKIHTEIETSNKGIIVTQTSEDATAVAVLQKHAGEVSDFVREGMVALHNAMGRMMMQGAGPVGGPPMLQNGGPAAR